ncbi:unnamed protein product [Closterium sp. NIES-54]
MLYAVCRCHDPCTGTGIDGRKPRPGLDYPSPSPFMRPLRDEGGRWRDVLLVLDSYRGHLTERVGQTMRLFRLTRAVISGGCTPLVQLLDVSIKAGVRHVMATGSRRKGSSAQHPQEHDDLGPNPFNPALVVTPADVTVEAEEEAVLAAEADEADEKAVPAKSNLSKSDDGPTGDAEEWSDEGDEWWALGRYEGAELRRPLQPDAPPSAACEPPLQPARRPCSPLAARLRPAHRPYSPLAASLRPARRPSSPLAAPATCSLPARRPCSPLAARLRPVRHPYSPLAAYLRPASRPLAALSPPHAAREPRFSSLLAAPCSLCAAPCSPLASPCGLLAAPCSPRAARWQPACCPGAARSPPIGSPLATPLPPFSCLLAALLQPARRPPLAACVLARLLPALLLAPPGYCPPCC